MRSLSTGPRLSLALRELSIRQAHEAFIQEARPFQKQQCMAQVVKRLQLCQKAHKVNPASDTFEYKGPLPQICNL